MSTQPIECLGHDPDWIMHLVRTQEANGRAVEILLDYTPVPAPVIIARPEAVYVMVTAMDDLGQWLYERGGEVHVSPAFEGMRVWTLHTHTDAARDGSRVAIRVSVAVPDGEPVMHEIAAAVTR
ncbi:hypothetical protein AB0K71_06110 [Streptomyces syringium]|uniref:hypothetical protein n=1 Tax=Streptomyces syringium TaxID=76729 RepID=UPI0034380E1A